MRLLLKRHYPLPVLLVLVSIFLTMGIGDSRIIAYTIAGNLEVPEIGVTYTNEIDLFDDTIVHSIQILIDETDYDRMITTYQETGSKDYFHADLIIDGVRVENAGIRLKGNASLRTALGVGEGAGMFGGENRGQAGRENQLPVNPENMPDFGNRPEFDPDDLPDQENLRPGFMPGEREMPDGANRDLFEDRLMGGIGRNDQIPFLIKFDEFVPGQTYQGYTRLAIRSSGISYDSSMLQEPVTNDIFRLVGLPATRTAYTGLQLNDDSEQLFTISEVIDETYLAEYFANADGVLYKAELGSTMQYQGEDPSAYANHFTQETRVNDADLAPLIDFIRFVSEADDETFESELADHLDIEMFALYLAANNLLVNTDSMAGMGNNYYLYFDDNFGKFTVLMWDANESLGKLSSGSQAAAYDIYYQGQQGMGRGMGGSNLLVSRFLADPSFKALYEQMLKGVYQQAFLSGEIGRQIEQYTQLIRSVSDRRNLVDAEAYDTAAVDVLDFISRRSEYLATTSLLKE